jgi:hypothetical protein
MSRIHLTIDRIVLGGFEPADHGTLLEGLEAELRRALADPATRAIWARPHRTPVLKLGRMPFESGPSGSRKFGTRVGGAIGRGLKP